MLVISILLVSFWVYKMPLTGLRIPHPDLSSYGQRSDFTWNAVGPEGGEVSRISTNNSNPNQKIAVSFRLWNKQGGSQWSSVSNLWHSLDGTFTGPNKAVVAFDDGIYYSNDGGVSWFPSLSYSWFQALSEHKGDTVYVVADGTVFVSYDGGVNFNAVAPVGFDINTIDYAPSNPSRVYASASISDTTAAVLVSNDGGVTWSWSIPPSSSFDIDEVYDVEVNPWNENEVLAAITTRNGPGLILISNDGGTSWDTLIGAFISQLFYPTDIEYLSNDTIIVANMLQRGVFAGYRVGPQFIFFSIDSTGYPTDVDIGSDGSINVATTSGVLYSPGPGSQFTWNNDGLKNVYVFREPQMSNMVNDRLIVLPSIVGGVLYRTSDGGQTWDRVIIDNMVVVSSVRISTVNPDVVYLTGLGVEFNMGNIMLHTIYKSINFGSTWAPTNTYSINERIPFLMDVNISPSNTNDILIAGDDSLYRSLDGGTSLTGQFAGIYPYLPGESDLVFVYSEQTNEILYTLNHGDTWQSTGINLDYPANIELNPFEHSLYFVVQDYNTGGYSLLRITTGGGVDTLLNLGQNAFLTGLEVASNGGLYINYIEDQGGFVFGRSNDFGQTWEFDTTESVPGTFIRASGNQVILSTFGMSLYRSVDAVTDVFENQNQPFNSHLLLLTPLVLDNLRFVFTSPSRENLKIGIFNAAGQVVYSERLPKTRESIEINLPVRYLPSGTYFLRIGGDPHIRETFRFFKIK